MHVAGAGGQRSRDVPGSGWLVRKADPGIWRGRPPGRDDRDRAMTTPSRCPVRGRVGQGDQRQDRPDDRPGDENQHGT